VFLIGAALPGTHKGRQSKRYSRFFKAIRSCRRKLLAVVQRKRNAPGVLLVEDLMARVTWAAVLRLNRIGAEIALFPDPPNVTKLLPPCHAQCRLPVARFVPGCSLRRTLADRYPISKADPAVMAPVAFFR